MKYCSKCGKQIMDEAVICPGCGCAVAGAPTVQNNQNQEESPALATVGTIFAILMPIVGLILGIIGACKYKTEDLKKKSIGVIVASIGMWVFWFFILMAMGM